MHQSALQATRADFRRFPRCLRGGSRLLTCPRSIQESWCRYSQARRRPTARRRLAAAATAARRCVSVCSSPEPQHPAGHCAGDGCLWVRSAVHRGGLGSCRAQGGCCGEVCSAGKRWEDASAVAVATNHSLVHPQHRRCPLSFAVVRCIDSSFSAHATRLRCRWAAPTAPAQHPPFPATSPPSGWTLPAERACRHALTRWAPWRREFPCLRLCCNKGVHSWKGRFGVWVRRGAVPAGWRRNTAHPLPAAVLHRRVVNCAAEAAPAACEANPEASAAVNVPTRLLDALQRHRQQHGRCGAGAWQRGPVVAAAAAAWQVLLLRRCRAAAQQPSSTPPAAHPLLPPKCGGMQPAPPGTCALSFNAPATAHCQ